MVSRQLHVLFAVLTAGWLLVSPPVSAEQPAPTARKKIVLLAGKLDAGHPRGTHEYERTLERLQDMLENSPLGDQLVVELHYDGWPRDEQTLEDADTIVLFSNGGDRNEEEHPFLVGDRWSVIRRQMQRGCGLVLLHWATFLPARHHDEALEWIGGYFDYQQGPPPQNWYSKIQHATVTVYPPDPASPDQTHPVAQGLKAFELTDEYYYRIRFRDNDPRLRPILYAPIPGEDEPQVVAWAVEREDGGRGFAYTGVHYLNSLDLPHFRRMLLNGIAWSAKLPIPPEGLSGEARRPIRAIIVTGHQYPGHLWRETTLALEDSLRADPRFEVDSIPDPEFLATERLHEYDVVLLNYCNWQQPEGLSEAGKQNFMRYLRDGGGLVIIHFANGAFHFSLPEAGESDWPEWRTKICRRVWDHTPGKSGHDPYGPMRVDIADPLHPITKDMEAFDTIDELYFQQQGDEPIHVVATARSQVTERDEPMAFVYNYGSGRVFQTVLGHAAESLRTDGAAELVRRGSAWAAFRLPKATQLQSAEGGIALAEGRFGQALDARRGGAELEHRAAYDTLPLTVECWVQAYDKDAFNIFVAKNPKSSPQHWEIYSWAGTGELSAYLPGYEPAEVRSGIPVTDGQWHHIAMTFDGRRLRLYVDGKMARQEFLRKTKEGTEVGPLWIGAYPPGDLGCRGLIDEVRISSQVRAIDGVPDSAPLADEATVGLWHFDEADANLGSPDASADANAARPIGATAKVLMQGPEHFDGFQESHVVDDRWKHMDTGPFFSGTIGLPSGPTWKGIVVRVGDTREASVCYDTELLRVSAAWSGFLEFSPARFGLIEIPKAASAVWFETPRQPGWARNGRFDDPRPHAPYGTLPRDWARYRELHLHGNRVVLSYDVGSVRVFESPWLERHDGKQVITRTFEIGPADEELKMCVGPSERAIGLRQDGTVGSLESDERGQRLLVIKPHAEPVRLKLLVGEPSVTAQDLEHILEQTAAPEPLAPLLEPGPARWGEPLVTEGERAADDAAYVVDTLTMPYENRFGALMFASGHDFLPNGDAAVCTAHGDVWIVRGINESLERLEWQRFATGLFQPLGLLVRGEQIYVVCRDQITILEDANHDGEADVYRNFNNDGHVTANGHEYVACLEQDSQGWFYFLKGDSGGMTAHDGTLMRVSPDGETLEVFATGIRNGNGLGIGPGDIVTFSPQEGNWTPASAIFEAQQGAFYGNMPTHHRPVPPTSMDPPLCWIPRWLDNSSGGQVWVPEGLFGPLSGNMLHLSFGRCRAMVVLRETIDGQAQGGVSPLAPEFLSGVMRGRFRPHDGHLYVTGLMGWVTRAVREGCFQRVRYTGRPAHMPTELHAHANGLAITFSDALDPAVAGDVNSYAIEQWNYRWSEEYGSPDVLPSDPRRRGHETVTIRSARLLDDGRTVFLDIPDIRPVMQMSVTYSLRAADGTPFRSGIYNTIHRLGAPHPAGGATAPIVDAASEPPETRPGLWVRWTSAVRPDAVDEHAVRLGAWRVEPQQPPALGLPAGPFRVRAEGFLKVPLREHVRFRIQGHGAARLTVNGLRVLDVTGNELGTMRSAPVPLRAGLNHVQLEYESASDGSGALRWFWSSDQFSDEPIPPEVLVHSAEAEASNVFAQRRAGHHLFATFGCANCHDSGATVTLEGSGNALQWRQMGPDLSDLGARVTPQWLYHWLLDPTSLRSDPRMPRVLPTGPAGDQQARDLAAYLMTLGGRDAAPAPQGGAFDEARAAAGEAVFESLGCITCHHFGPSKATDDDTRVSLRFVRAKYRPGALAAFLRNPAKHRPSGSRMPDFQLDTQEIDSLVAYLERRSSGELATVELSSADPERGARLFAETGCAQCHTNTALATSPRRAHLPPLRSPLNTDGCLSSASTRPPVPDFQLTAEQREALRAYIEAGAPQPDTFSGLDYANHMMAMLRCSACHDRDDRASNWPELLAEEGALGLPPEKIPSLTWTGEKLRSEWLEALLEGRITARPRPWLTARMPAFHGFGKGLANGLAAEHGVSTQSESSATPLGTLDRQFAEQLLSKNGLDCRQCHAPADEVLDDKNQAQGIGLSMIGDRLREEYYYRWMRNPLRIDPATKMPQFTLDGKTTQASHIAGGDAARQFQALWKYLQNL